MSHAPIHGCTVGGLLRRATELYRSREAVVSPERGVRWSFAELDRQADLVAAACQARGLKPGDRAVVWCINIPEWVALQYGLARAGVVLVTANTNFKRAEIGFILGKSRARALFFGRGTADNDFPATLERLDPGECPTLELLVGVDGAATSGSLSLDQFLESGTAITREQIAARAAELDRNDVINMQYTSGTTGFPKGVMLTHRNIVQNAADLGRVLGNCPDDRLCLTVPLFHCFGCVIGTLVAHNSGTAMILNDAFRPDDILDTVEQERCTHIYGVPTMYLAELEAERRKARDLSSLKCAVMAGAACPEQLIRDISQAFGIQAMLVAYGLTEASPGVTLSEPKDDLDLRATTVGRALPGVEVRIVNPITLETVATGERGELWTRGEHIMSGYDDEPEATRAAITCDGWLRTGDLAVEGESGCLQIVGRIKELIIRGGENISPAEVEDVLRGHRAVLDAAVFAIHSDFFGEDVAAAVRLVPGRTATAEELQEAVRSTLADQKVPAKILFLQSFPLTGSGKIQRFKLREMVEQST